MAKLILLLWIEITTSAIIYKVVENVFLCNFMNFIRIRALISVVSDILYAFPTQMKRICNKELAKGERERDIWKLYIAWHIY